jgi:polysaccharide pyruvyl transferase WcaK-like protein
MGGATTTSPTIGVLGHYGNFNLGDEAIIHATLEAVRGRWPDSSIYAISNRPSDSARRHQVPSVSVLTGELKQPPRDPEVPATVEAQPATPARGDDGAREEESGPGWPWRQPALRAARRLAGSVVRGIAWSAHEVVYCLRVFRRVRHLDLLLIAGSNQLADNFGGPRQFPYVNLRWSVLARLAGCRVAWVSVGAGPLRSSWSRRFVRTSLRIADYVSVRDKGSLRVLREIGVRRDVRVAPDLAHGLAHEPVPRERRAGDRLSRATVAINPMPIFDGRYWPEWAPDKYARYVSELAAFAVALVKEGYEPFFFSTHPRDALLAREILTVMDLEHGIRLPDALRVRASATVTELLGVLRSADLVVPTRFHGALLSLLLERPTLAICYYQKTHDLMMDFGQGEEFAVAIEEFRGADAMARVLSLEARTEELTALMRQRNTDCRAALDEQYDLIFGLLGSPTRAGSVTATPRR